ncbi:EF-hand domain-containing protein [Methylobacterium sp. E-065]|uniref:EF-hand domain-containing protein n=1 Tax=Methylobacterium sp. E-065 TaxID=2836583 RepID=UPI001FB9A8FD|nr:EF-hand domain-containing protein [Methylobacterium sp. E-065]MCJ2018628.1 EF-hand domain-containing protein [Methylobacterium sp. E-065]
MRRIQPTTAFVMAALVAVPLSAASDAWARSSSASKEIRAIDTDNDGTIDLKEAQAAGEATFDKLEKDKDSSLTAKELQGRVSKKDLRTADGDHDGTMDKKEYDALVEQRFKAADTDGDGTLDAKELKKPAGRSLLQLLK